MHPFVSLCTGKYYYLPNASDAVISAATKTALTDLKGSWFWSMSNRSSTFWWAANLRLCSNCVAVFKAWWAFWLSSCDKFWCRSLVSTMRTEKKILSMTLHKIECPLLSNVWQYCKLVTFFTRDRSLLCWVNCYITQIAIRAKKLSFIWWLAYN